MIPELDLVRLRRYCDGRVPEHALHQVRVELEVDPRAATIVERRAPWRPDFGPEWTRLPIARLRYVQRTGAWTLYWRDRNLRWHRYDRVGPSARIDTLLAERHGMGILTYSPLAGGWLSGSWTSDSTPTSPARQRLAARFDMSLTENQGKLEAVEQLAKVADDAGVSLIELAIAFVVNHPAVTSAIIGPRTMEQLESQLPAADVALDAAVLDRIDEIVRPGVNLNPADTSYGTQALQPAARRR